MAINNTTLGRIRRKTYYRVILQGTQPGSGFAALGPATGVGATPLFAAILRPVRGGGSAGFGASAPASFAEGADIDDYGNVLQIGVVPAAGDAQKAKDRITAVFECGQADPVNGAMPHGCIQFITPTDAVSALDLVAAPALADPTTQARPFIRVLFVPTPTPLSAFLYFQKQHSLEA